MLLHSKGEGRQAAVLVWLVISLSVVIVVVALAMDGGRTYAELRRVQVGADAAAQAGAAQITQGIAMAEAAALQNARDNGHNNNQQSSFVTVRIPPTQGLFAGQSGYVEVVIESRISGTFCQLFHNGPLSTKARAVASGPTSSSSPGSPGILILEENNQGAVFIDSNAYVEVTGNSINVNSKHNASYELKSGTIKAQSHELRGKMKIESATVVGPVRTQGAKTADPFATLAAPSTSGVPVRRTSKLTVTSGTTTLQPGLYKGGLSMDGNAKINLQPGTYIIDGGGITLKADARLSGSGVTIYNTGGSSAGSISLDSNATMTLTPPNEGTYDNISIFQDRAVTKPLLLNSNTILKASGIIYAPAAGVELDSNALLENDDGAVLVKTLKVLSNGRVEIDATSLAGSGGGGGSASTNSRVVE